MNQIVLKNPPRNPWKNSCFFPSIFKFVFHNSKRCDGLMISALDSGSSGPGSSPGRGHFVVFLGKTLYFHGASLHPGVQMGISK